MNNLLVKKKTIGILGGMGPAASAHLYQRLIELAQRKYGANQDCTFPAMIMYSLPLTEWNTTGFLNLESVKQQLISGVRKLESAGSDFIILGCNTVHHFFANMQRAVRIPIVNMIEETALRAKYGQYSRVVVLATKSSMELGIYTKSLEKHGISVVDLTQNQQSAVTEVIGHIEAGILSKFDTAVLQRIIADTTRRGAQAIILGCTELPLVIKQENVKIPLLNSTDILADAAIDYSYARELPAVKPAFIPSFFRPIRFGFSRGQQQ